MQLATRNPFQCPHCGDASFGPWRCTDGVCDDCAEGGESRETKKRLIVLGHATSLQGACAATGLNARELTAWLTADSCANLTAARACARELWQEQQLTIVGQARSEYVQGVRRLVESAKPPWILGIADRWLGPEG